ncbi:branched chain amino acid ABC transporter substrate-binding protein (plasmid) [Azospirillum baldaniorum]|uniref:ABC branched chain amino acid family transporter, periplasmic ligand binding protein n=1 Tax=Azospirillum baldaniorum TaxID=1064539 RepID=A0A9P1K1C1_9PROT|nr:penicillin-binding protein activator [Azospirillum baldaniorum]AWJ94680.1 branched chain amino acid ABC transporter substrate-binding protein [Azospirillum baldaniorum]NUB08929.1 ABC transporter substrate-binding protein [Azospirillum baldaniorum]TWA73234.1 amino acid/amide ABC transporter substrate-binding protein (HAAT family) [Azospirillum brasilense]CCD03689.1 ABC branched chain amino acid family transporter, periplasmic ligand binding protein [Azospirillum baldaniorum]
MRNVVLGGLLLTGIAASVPAQAQDTVRIGLVQPLTGSVAYNGKSVVEGARLAVEEMNAAGGVLGKKIELIVEDGQCTPANSVNAVEKLVQKDKVVTLVGAFCSSATAAIMPVAQKYKLPLITGVSSKASLTEQGNPYFFRAAETDALMAEAFAKILANDLKLTKVAYIGVNDDWGRGGVEEFSRDLTALGVKTVLTEYFDHGATDFFTLLTKLRAAKPDGVFVAAETQDGSILVKQIREMGLDTKVFGVGSWATADFINLTGEAAEGIHAAVPYASSMDTPRNQTFVQKYQAKYGIKPGKYGAAGYNALNIAGQAIARAGGTDAEAIRAALAKTSYEAPNGVYKFTDKGQAYGFDAVLVRIEKGEPKVIASTPVDAPH